MLKPDRFSCSQKIWLKQDPPVSDYNIIFVHIKGDNNIFFRTNFQTEILDIYKELLDNPKSSDTMTCIAAMVSSDIQTLSIDKLHAKQK